MDIERNYHHVFKKEGNPLLNLIDMKKLMRNGYIYTYKSKLVDCIIELLNAALAISNADLDQLNSET